MITTPRTTPEAVRHRCERDKTVERHSCALPLHVAYELHQWRKTRYRHHDFGWYFGPNEGPVVRKHRQIGAKNTVDFLENLLMERVEAICGLSHEHTFKHTVIGVIRDLAEAYVRRHSMMVLSYLLSQGRKHDGAYEIPY